MKMLSSLLKNRKIMNPATLLKLTLPQGSFSRFLNCTNDIKSHNASHFIKNIYKITVKLFQLCVSYRAGDMDFKVVGAKFTSEINITTRDLGECCKLSKYRVGEKA